MFVNGILTYSRTIDSSFAFLVFVSQQCEYFVCYKPNKNNNKTHNAINDERNDGAGDSLWQSNIHQRIIWDSRNENRTQVEAKVVDLETEWNGLTFFVKKVLEWWKKRHTDSKDLKTERRCRLLALGNAGKWQFLWYEHPWRRTFAEERLRQIWKMICLLICLFNF